MPSPSRRLCLALLCALSAGCSLVLGAPDLRFVEGDAGAANDRGAAGDSADAAPGDLPGDDAGATDDRAGASELDVAADGSGTDVAHGDAATGDGPPDAEAVDAGPPCAPTETRCGERCVDPRTDPSHCGGCGRACTTGVQGATAVCEGGTCQSRCPLPLTECAGRCVDARSDLANCGSCGSACSTTVSGATAACDEGVCRAQCPAGLRECAGRCVNIETELAHCGDCGRVCQSSVAGATPVCEAGQCGARCPPGQVECAGRCIDLTTDGAHCGACDRACTPAAGGVASCADGRCGTTCPVGQVVCSDRCVSLANNPEHCGACGNVCQFTGATAVCRAGVCARDTCTPGNGDCDGNSTNGCETSTVTSVLHCGRCGNACALRGASAHVCTGGVCAASACLPGFGNCDGDATNGCETATSSSLAHCGACNRACSVPMGTAACNAGVCAVAGCAAGRGNCDGNVANGCETELATSAAHCGACGRACGALPSATSVACRGGQCVAATCAGTRGDCDGVPSNGCETELSNNPAHCGACGRSCAGGICGGGVCRSFGGSWQTSGCNTCSPANPYLNACGCLGGSIYVTALSTLTDCGRVIQSNTQFFCGSATAREYGGVYQIDANGVCRSPNAYTRGCACPAGWTGIVMRVVLAQTSPLYISHPVLCYRAGQSAAGFAGAYQLDDRGVCRTANPATGACSCPAGYAVTGYRAITDVDGRVFGGHIWVCLR